MKKVCQNCKYFRTVNWCSNSKSPNYLYTTAAWVSEFGTCKEFTPHFKKAPLWMRVFNKIMRGRAK